MNHHFIFRTTATILLFQFVFIVSLTASDGTAQMITRFCFSRQDIGWSGSGYWEGVIDQGAKTITFTTQQWIENINKLPAVFELDADGEAKVYGMTQRSGITLNDFRRDVVYTVGEANYTVIFVSPQANGVPVIRIDTENGAAITSKETWVNMTFTLTDPNDSRNDVIRTANYEQIRGRGNSTWSYSKKPYRIRFNNHRQVGFFGLPEARNWVLLAEFQDPTFLMNAVAFELGRNIFDLPFTCSYQHVQVYLNGRYNGLYILTEHRQADPAGVGAPGRVKVDLKEGWFVELDSYWDEEPRFRTSNYNLPIMIKSPEFDPQIMTNPAYQFVKSDWDKLCNFLKSAGFPENEYRDLIDMSTFVDFLLINEIVLNGELAHPKSVFAYRDKGGNISMGPLWDMDWGYGYVGGHTYFSDYPHSSWGAPNTMRSPKHEFFHRFFDDPVFLLKYKEQWNVKYSEIVAVTEFIDNIGKKIRTAVAEDSKRWNISGGYWSGYDTNHDRQITNMKNWWSRRMNWLHTELNKVEVYPKNKTFTTQMSGYPEIAPQTFTLVAYGDVTNLSAIFQKAGLSDFEISADFIKTSTENGGYLVSVSVKPKQLLPAARYTDVLVLSGSNQGNTFSFSIPLTFVVEKATEYKVNFSVVGGKGTIEATVNDANIMSGARVEGGSTIVFTATPYSNYRVKEWRLNGLAINGNTSNTYTLGILSKDATVLVTFDPNTNNETLPENPLKAWTHNGLLYVSGLTAGEILSVYNVSGALVYHSMMISDTAVIPLKVRGAYIVCSKNHTIKVMY